MEYIFRVERDVHDFDLIRIEGEKTTSERTPSLEKIRKIFRMITQRNFNIRPDAVYVISFSPRTPLFSKITINSTEYFIILTAETRIEILKQFLGAHSGHRVILVTKDRVLSEYKRYSNANRAYLTTHKRIARRVRSADDIKQIVIHITGGRASAARTAENFRRKVNNQNKEPAVAAHYIVGRNGETYQVLSEIEVGFHSQWSSKSIGIEHAVQWGRRGRRRIFEFLTDEQYRASVTLIKDICNRYTIPQKFLVIPSGDNDAGIVEHRQTLRNGQNLYEDFSISSGHVVCPAPCWNWYYFLNLLKGQENKHPTVIFNFEVNQDQPSLPRHITNPELGFQRDQIDSIRDVYEGNIKKVIGYRLCHLLRLTPARAAKFRGRNIIIDDDKKKRCILALLKLLGLLEPDSESNSPKLEKGSRYTLTVDTEVWDFIEKQVAIPACFPPPSGKLRKVDNDQLNNAANSRSLTSSTHQD